MSKVFDSSLTHMTTMAFNRICSYYKINASIYNDGRYECICTPDVARDLDIRCVEHAFSLSEAIVHIRGGKNNLLVTCPDCINVLKEHGL